MTSSSTHPVTGVSASKDSEGKWREITITASPWVVVVSRVTHGPMQLSFSELFRGRMTVIVENGGKPKIRLNSVPLRYDSVQNLQTDIDWEGGTHD